MAAASIRFRAHATIVGAPSQDTSWRPRRARRTVSSPPAHPGSKPRRYPSSGTQLPSGRDGGARRRGGEPPRIGVVLVAALEVARSGLASRQQQLGTSGQPCDRVAAAPPVAHPGWVRAGCGSSGRHASWLPGWAHPSAPATSAGEAVDESMAVLGPHDVLEAPSTETGGSGRRRPARRPRGPGGRRVATWRRSTIPRARLMDQPARLRHRRHDRRGTRAERFRHRHGRRAGATRRPARRFSARRRAFMATRTGPHAASPSVTAINRIVRPWRTSKRRRAPAPKISSSGCGATTTMGRP